jgi:hypothetical protein
MYGMFTPFKRKLILHHCPFPDPTEISKLQLQEHLEAILKTNQ